VSRDLRRRLSSVEANGASRPVDVLQSERSFSRRNELMLNIFPTKAKSLKSACRKQAEGKMQSRGSQALIAGLDVAVTA
jgi:hypothetical protein